MLGGFFWALQWMSEDRFGKGREFFAMVVMVARLGFPVRGYEVRNIV